MFQKLFFISLLVGGYSLNAMESIVLEPLSEAEVKTMTLPAFFKGIDAPQEDSWQELSAYKPGGKNDWLSLVGATLGQRLGRTHLRDINCLADKFFTVLASHTSRLHHDSPLGKDWRAYKKGFVVFHLLGAKNSYYLNSQWQGTLQNERKRNMLRCAFWQDDFAFAKYLRSLEAFLYAHTEQESLLHEARSAAIAELFYSPNANYREGHTLLHSACAQQRKADLVTFYLDKGFDVNAVDDFGHTPLGVIAHVAFYEPVERVEAKVKALLKAGADVTVQEEGKTLTEIALEYKVPDKVGDRYFPESVDRFVALLQEAAKRIITPL